ncbi:MAG TPA: hypothetical protein PKY29_03850 [Ferruginibacter sp.]|nr:hypothetical protein [Ferruginibacter sp.]HRN79152.1 hypothetical protein [Ferruginibacter sp.]HRO18642.1 hypothetical protein [Ferruginibacter sp.]HRQ20419.1 hypothetical protein [Ferruginibacter sp.]
MKFFYKVAMIANICFVVSVVLRYVEINRTENESGPLIPLAPLQNIVVILGYSSILINALWMLTALIWSLSAAKPVIAQRTMWVIGFFLIIQSVYFIFLP